MSDAASMARPATVGAARASLGDFTADRRMLVLAAMALVVGAGGASTPTSSHASPT